MPGYSSSRYYTSMDSSEQASNSLILPFHAGLSLCLEALSTWLSATFPVSPAICLGILYPWRIQVSSVKCWDMEVFWGEAFEAFHSGHQIFKAPPPPRKNKGQLFYLLVLKWFLKLNSDLLRFFFLIFIQKVLSFLPPPCWNSISASRRHQAICPTKSLLILQL